MDDWNCHTDVYAAINSWSKVLYLLLAAVRHLLKKPRGHQPSRSNCSRTPPMPDLDASVLRAREQDTQVREKACVGKGVLGSLEREDTCIRPGEGDIGVLVIHEVVQRSQDRGSTWNESVEVIDQTKEFGKFFGIGRKGELLHGLHLVWEWSDTIGRHEVA